MIPLRDDVPAARRPVVTQALIAICAAVFLLQLGDQDGELLYRFGMVPGRVFDPDSPLWQRSHYTAGGLVPAIGAAAVPDWLTLLTCTFLHGGWLHFLGNMLFLWVFGDNVEDRFGRLPFLAFYLASGIAASLAHLYSAPGSPVPTIGASGAVAGVMGAYLLLYPRAHVEMLIVFGFFIDVIVLRAPFFLVYWFALQLLGGALEGSTGGGVAWWAHIGGFVLGALAALLLRLLGRLRPEPAHILLRRRRLGRSPR
ncbi:MAG: rhomboid family intramembrane serine protease [Planctomycetes bacterium]|nr:rhomboid family intramembrane serine protease [Planctomycetota bacterium]